MLKKKLSICCTSVVVACCLASGFSADTLAKKSKPARAKGGLGWVFEMSTDKSGRHQMLISSDGLKLRMKSFTAILRAPEFNAIVINTTSKKYTKMPYEKWKRLYLNRTVRPVRKTGKTAKIAGLRVTSYIMSTRALGMQKEYWMTNDLKIPDELKGFVCDITGFPPGMGVPVKIVAHRRGASDLVTWSTLSYKREKISPRKFDPPAGFKRVENEMELLVEDDDAAGMADLMR